MKKIIIYSTLFTILLFSMGALRCHTLNPLLWAWGSITAFCLTLPVGLLVITSFANEDLKKISHWAVLALGFLTALFVIFEILYPGLK